MAAPAGKVDVLTHFFSFLTARQTAGCARVCSEWYLAAVSVPQELIDANLRKIVETFSSRSGFSNNGEGEWINNVGLNFGSETSPLRKNLIVKRIIAQFNAKMQGSLRPVDILRQRNNSIDIITTEHDQAFDAVLVRRAFDPPARVEERREEEKDDQAEAASSASAAPAAAAAETPSKLELLDEPI
jgi:hypothetical protein